ncbi:MAG: 6,7-dimethyl-8-ribityllumazine synthase [Acidimicrobiales bacterium]|nr:6,7-dimethyl-8-ribityllumazine synthase [Acidimicrobiales bacterium]
MAGDLQSPHAPEPVIDGTGLRIAVLAARFNSVITLRLLDGVRRGLADAGVAEVDVTEAWVPGAFELPLAAKTFAESGRVDAVICIGCVIRGETTHYESVAGESAAGILRAGLATGVPIVFGVLTTEDTDQALARSEGPGGHNVGEEGAAGAVEMATLVRTVRGPTPDTTD